MPWASEPKAPWVEVWLSPQTMVMPGRVKPCSGPDHVDDALADVELVEVLDAEILGVLGESRNLGRGFGILDAVRAVGGRHVVVDHGQRLARLAHLAAGHAQALEGLRARDLMDEVAVDVEKARPVILLIDDVVVPDLVIEGAGFSHGSLPTVDNKWFGVFSGRTPGREDVLSAHRLETIA